MQAPVEPTDTAEQPENVAWADLTIDDVLDDPRGTREKTWRAPQPITPREVLLVEALRCIEYRDRMRREADEYRQNAESREESADKADSALDAHVALLRRLDGGDTTTEG